MRIALLIGLVALLIGAWALLPQSGDRYPEHAELAVRGDWSFTELSNYFRRLAEKKGAPYAFDVLLAAPLPSGTDVHLLGHTVGNVLYAQQGITGIRECTQDFRNACAHSVVIGALLEHGEGALGDIAAACAAAPGGSGAYTMCFHGLGHGVLAYTGYELEKAVEMCSRMGTTAYQQREYAECVGGAVMEMNDGVHDPQVWLAQRDTYFRDDDPLYPCTASFMPREVQDVCYTYLTPRLLRAVGIGLDAPVDSDWSRAFALCAPLVGDSRLRDACYGGFGKEFVTLVRGRDVRDVGAMAEAELSVVRSLCSQAGIHSGEAACLTHALYSLFWGGENRPDASFRFCAIADGDAQDTCYRELAGQIAYYQGGMPKGAALCERLPERYRSSCTP